MSDEKYIIHLSARHMSGRVVEFRVLELEEIEACNRNGAVEATESATRDELRVAQLKHLVAAMITRYTKGRVESLRRPLTPEQLKKRAPGDTDTDMVINGKADPASLTAATWVGADAKTLLFGKVFNAKETEVLRMMYTEHHELTHAEVMVLSGKAQPAPTGD
jgi:hypothetical protein